MKFIPSLMTKQTMLSTGTKMMTRHYNVITILSKMQCKTSKLIYLLHKREFLSNTRVNQVQ